MKKYLTVAITLPPQIVEKVRSEATALGVTPTWVLRKIVETYYNEVQKKK